MKSLKRNRMLKLKQSYQMKDCASNVTLIIFKLILKLKFRLWLTFEGEMYRTFEYEYKEDKTYEYFSHLGKESNQKVIDSSTFNCELVYKFLYILITIR